MTNQYPKAVYDPEDGKKFTIVHTYEQELALREELGLDAPPLIQLGGNDGADQWEPKEGDATDDEIIALRAEVETLRAEKAQREAEAVKKAEAKAESMAKARAAKKTGGDT